MAILRYEGIARKAMSDLKFHGKTDNADFFAAKAASHEGNRIRNFNPDALIPVPVHKTRFARRGYNQAELICDRIGAILGIRVVNDFLLRTKKTGFQKNLDKIKRRGNLSNAFECDSTIYPRERVESEFKKVLLVDDIYTTGSTMEHCTRALLAAGVGRVGLLSICIGEDI